LLGKIVGVDVIKILPLDGVHLIFGDFTKVETQKEIVKSFVVRSTKLLTRNE